MLDATSLRLSPVEGVNLIVLSLRGVVELGAQLERDFVERVCVCVETVYYECCMCEVFPGQ